MSDFSFDYDASAAEQIKAGMDTGDFIRLPFDTVLWRWVRGEANQPAEGNGVSGVKHFGGWAAAEENMRDFAKTIPTKFEPEMFTTPDGQKAFMNYCTRQLAVAPICQRSRWFKQDQNDPLAKARKHLQVVCYAALREAGEKEGEYIYTPWMPVILSIKGLSATKLEEAFKAWKDATSTLRSTIVKDNQPTIPPNFFWCHIGTFGKTRNVQTVGKAGAQNYITPPICYVPEPDKLTVEFLRRCFVGKEMTTTLGQLAEESREWLDAWKEAPKDQQAQPQAQNTKAQPPKAKAIDEGVPF